jgi:enoyl-[acyl-carrier-protein] reductase (NADH)
VTNSDHLDTLADRVGEHVPHLDGVVHSIGFAPQTAMGGIFSIHRGRTSLPHCRSRPSH